MAVSTNETVIDIQEAFDSLLVCEDNLVQEAYKEGLVQGENIGFQEGFELGQNKGSQISSEIHFYKGFAKCWIALISDDISGFSNTFLRLLEPLKTSLDTVTVVELENIQQQLYQRSQEKFDPKALKVLEKLLYLLHNFPDKNLQNQDFVDLLQNIRAKFKHCCALLKVDTIYSKNTELSF